MVRMICTGISLWGRSRWRRPLSHETEDSRQEKNFESSRWRIGLKARHAWHTALSAHAWNTARSTPRRSSVKCAALKYILTRTRQIHKQIDPSCKKEVKENVLWWASNQPIAKLTDRSIRNHLSYRRIRITGKSYCVYFSLLLNHLWMSCSHAVKK